MQAQAYLPLLLGVSNHQKKSGKSVKPAATSLAHMCDETTCVAQLCESGGTKRDCRGGTMRPAYVPAHMRKSPRTWAGSSAVLATSYSVTKAVSMSSAVKTACAQHPWW